MKNKLKVGILGASGAVGQRFVSLLSNHPWFTISSLMASERSQGKSYGTATKWLLPDSPSDDIFNMTVNPCHPGDDIDLVFSGLPAEKANTIEPLFAEHGIPVISNTRSYRMDPLVPLIVPEINLSHLQLIPFQMKKYSAGGFIVTNPNCSTIVLALALDPIHRQFCIKRVMVSTAQAVSGAGFPGLSVMSMLDNAIPYIDGEEPKLESEPLKIFGEYHDGSIIPAEIPISASCMRVSVTNGHLMNVSLELEKSATRDEIIRCWDEYQSDIETDHLPSMPQYSVEYLDAPDRPQPLLDRDRGSGMTVTTGRLRECPVMDWKFTALGHNTIRGAAGGSILLAELLIKQGYIGSDSVIL